jgi:SNF2 family DNA or RNA helicase
MANYALNIAGHDAHHRCADVLIVEPAFNYATEHQGYARCYRIGQTEEVDITRLFVEETY